MRASKIVQDTLPKYSLQSSSFTLHLSYLDLLAGETERRARRWRERGKEERRGGES